MPSRLTARSLRRAQLATQPPVLARELARALPRAVERRRGPAQVRPIPIASVTVRLLAYTHDHRHAWFTDVPLDADGDATLTPDKRHARLVTAAQTVAAIVSLDEPTEKLLDYAPYRLTVNGTLQPGGCALTLARLNNPAP